MSSANEPKDPEDMPEEDPPSVAEARQTVARATALFNAGNFSAALSEFERAYELLAGDPRRPTVLNNIAVCYERMFRYDLALTFYRRYLVEAAPTGADRAEVQTIVRTLDNLLGTLEIRSNVTAEVWVDHHRVGDAPGRVRIPAGRHLIELRAPVVEVARKEVQITAGQTMVARFELQRLSRFSGLHPRYFWISAGLTVAAAATGTAFGISAVAGNNDAQRRVDRGYDPEPEIAAVRRKTTSADIAFGAAAVLAVSSAVVFFLTDFSGRDRPAEESPPAGRLGLGPLQDGGAVLQLDGVLP